jgi:thiamine biosynthesis protein ThiS
MSEGGTIRIKLNGEEREIPTGATVEALLRSLDLHPKLVVVERNGDIMRRDAYADVHVEEGDTLELVHFVGGGRPAT